MRRVCFLLISHGNKRGQYRGFGNPMLIPPNTNKQWLQPWFERDARSSTVAGPGVSVTLGKLGHYPKRVQNPMFKGSWRV